MKRSILLATALLLGSQHAHAQHSGHDMPTRAEAKAWTQLPLVVARARGPMAAEISLANSSAGEVTFSPPKGSAHTLTLANGRTEVKAEIGNYHLVSAVDACDSHVATASTPVYFSNPGPAPTTLLKQEQAGLTVLPLRLPREHGAWRAGEVARFRVAFDGKPFPGAKVRLETSNGSRIETDSQLDGTAEITFPDDFAPRDQRPPEAHGRPTQAQFVIAAISQTGTVQHVGAFNHVYRPGAFDGTSVWTGLGFAALGMVSATPLLRRRAKGGRK